MFIIFALTALGALCWLLFHLAALALPLVAGISAAMLAYQSGAGLFGAGIVGFLGGVATLSVGQFLFATMRSPTLRVLTAMLFAAPAAMVGFSVVHRIMVAGDSNEVWAVILGVMGATVTAGVAIAKVSALAPNTRGGALLTGSETPGVAVGAPSRRQRLPPSRPGVGRGLAVKCSSALDQAGMPHRALLAGGHFVRTDKPTWESV